MQRSLGDLQGVLQRGDQADPLTAQSWLSKAQLVLEQPGAVAGVGRAG